MKKIVLFVPARNEEATLAKVLEEIPKQVLSYAVEIVVANDASTDGTAEIARRFTDHVITLPRQSGVGAATKAGFLYATQEIKQASYIVKMDADGQHLPNLISQVVEKLERRVGVVCCSRFHPDSDTSEAPLSRLLLNNAFAHLISSITGWKVSDARTGFMGFHFGDIQVIAKDLITEGYGIPMELLLRVHRLNRFARFVEIAHPALYENVSDRLNEKYLNESVDDEAERFKRAADALLTVLYDLKISGADVSDLQNVRDRRAGDYRKVG